MNDVAGSKELQDEMVLKLLGHGTLTEPKFFLDLGSGHPIFGNNTVILEKAGWKGLLFDKNGSACTQADKCRGHSKAICCDFTQEEILPYLVANHTPHIIDYISFDVDDGTLALIEQFPFEQYQFRIMTFEHDRYHRGNVFKDAMIARLQRAGVAGRYTIIAENVCFHGTQDHPENQFEDWWVNTLQPPFSGMLELEDAYSTGKHYEDVVQRLTR